MHLRLSVALLIGLSVTEVSVGWTEWPRIPPEYILTDQRMCLLISYGYLPGNSLTYVKPATVNVAGVFSFQ